MSILENINGCADRWKWKELAGIPGDRKVNDPIHSVSPRYIQVCVPGTGQHHQHSLWEGSG